MSSHSIIEHRANYHYFKLEEDYVAICSFGEQYPQCKAAILAVLEHWINDKRLKGQEEKVYMTYPEWIDAMYGLFRRSTIIVCLNELINEGLITRYRCRRHGKDTFEYTLNIKEVQARIRELPERTEKYTRPNLNGFKFKRVQKQTGLNLDGSTNPNLNGSEHDDPFKSKRNIDSITEIPDNIDSSNAQSANAIAPHTAATKIEIEIENDEDGSGDGNGTNTSGDILPSIDSNAHRTGNAAPGNGRGRLLHDAVPPTAPTPTPPPPPQEQEIDALSYSPHLAIGKTDINPVLQAKTAELHKTKPARKPKAAVPIKAVVNAEEEARITAVFDAFDDLAREMYVVPDFSYVRSKAAREAIIAFLAIKPTPTTEKLRTHYSDLFKRPRSKDGFLWSENMSIAAVCRDYGRKPVLSATPASPPVSKLTSDPEWQARNERNKARAKELAAQIRAKREAKEQEAQHAVSR